MQISFLQWIILVEWKHLKFDLVCNLHSRNGIYQEKENYRFSPKILEFLQNYCHQLTSILCIFIRMKFIFWKKESNSKEFQSKRFPVWRKNCVIWIDLFKACLERRKITLIIFKDDCFEKINKKSINYLSKLWVLCKQNNKIWDLLLS